MALTDIQNLLRRRIGLDAESIGRGAIERAVADRMAACRIADMETYLALVQHAAPELQELIEGVVVPETWFFRDAGAFTALTQSVYAASRSTPITPRRFLSLPCATGEEPYSMAMALIDAGIDAARFHIDAIDISARALQRAAAAHYGRNSFRGSELDFRERHFSPVDGGYRLNDAVRTAVQFHQGNLFALALPPEGPMGSAAYDAIFCRNLMIYFDRAEQAQALRRLAAMLKPGGLLFVAPAETAVLNGSGFVSLALPRAYAFRKQELSTRVPDTKPRTPAASSPKRVSARVPEPTLSEAEDLMGRGRLDEAVAICDEHQRRFGPSAEACYMIGLSREAEAPDQALRGYRQALYLKPDHRDALTRLSQLLERTGDVEAAQTLRRRLARLDLRQKSSHE